MGEYFKPWRRKFGVLMLLTDMAFASAWVRSLIVQDSLLLNCKHHQEWLISSSGQFSLQRMVTEYDAPWNCIWNSASSLADFDTIDDSIADAELVENPDDEAIERLFHGDLPWGWSSSGFRVSHFGGSAGWMVEAPYWSIVIPLTLLSASLLLGIPRVARPSVIGEK